MSHYTQLTLDETQQYNAPGPLDTTVGLRY